MFIWKVLFLEFMHLLVTAHNSKSGKSADHFNKSCAQNIKPPSPSGMLLAIWFKSPFLTTPFNSLKKPSPHKPMASHQENHATIAINKTLLLSPRILILVNWHFIVINVINKQVKRRIIVCDNASIYNVSILITIKIREISRN